MWIDDVLCKEVETRGDNETGNAMNGWCAQGGRRAYKSSQINCIDLTMPQENGQRREGRFTTSMSSFRPHAWLDIG